MPRTKVTNESNNTIILKEGNAGVFSELRTLHKDDSMVLDVTANATYREYWFAVDPETAGHKVILTSDDCLDYKVVKIVEDLETKKISWTGTKREERGSKSKESVFTWISRMWPFGRYLSNLVSC